MPSQTFTIPGCPRHATPANLITLDCDCPQCLELMMIYEYMTDMGKRPKVEVQSATD